MMREETAEECSFEPRSSGAWAKEKLEILRCYSTGFAAATKRAGSGCFVDGFAGPGYNLIRSTGEVVEGSPLIALQAGFGRIFLIEKDPSVADSLRQMITGLGEVAEVITGDANQEVIRCLERIDSWVPPLVFLDPTGLQLEWNTLRDISCGRGKRRTKRPELLINFPSDFDLLRKFRIGKTNALNERQITAFFGTEQWKSLESVQLRAQGARVTAQVRTELLELYSQRLQSDLGYILPPLRRDIRSSGGSTGRICRPSHLVGPSA